MVGAYIPSSIHQLSYPAPPQQLGRQVTQVWKDTCHPSRLRIETRPDEYSAGHSLLRLRSLPENRHHSSALCTTLLRPKNIGSRELEYSNAESLMSSRVGSRLRRRKLGGRASGPHRRGDRPSHRSRLRQDMTNRNSSLLASSAESHASGFMRNE